MLFITPPAPLTLVSIGLQGKLLGAWVDEARQVVMAARGSDRICLNLQGLTFADSRGVALLRALRRDGVPMVGCSALIEGLLDTNDPMMPPALTTDAPHGA